MGHLCVVDGVVGLLDCFLALRCETRIRPLRRDRPRCGDIDCIIDDFHECLALGFHIVSSCEASGVGCVGGGGGGGGGTEDLAETVEEKAATFQQAFFPVPPPADLSDIDPTEINRRPIHFPEITHQEITQAVKASPPDKAPGEGGLPNSLWHKLIEIPAVLDTISGIYNACIRLGTNPSHFQKSITVVLRKAGKRDYQLAKSYRPVALLNTLSKFLEAVIARSISYAVETHKLLPDTHLGGRKGISVDHAIQQIIGRVRRAWGNSKIASVLLLDVSGARGLRGGEDKRVGRRRCLHCHRKDEHETISKLQKACQYADAWAARHASVFDPKKYALIHFVNPGSREEGYTPLVLPSTTVQATTTAERYLGIWLDPGLTFRHHRQQMLAKAGISLQALRGLTGSAWGASLSSMRTIYQAVMIPQMLFGAAAWHSPLTTTLRERSYVKHIERQFRAPVRLYTDGSGYQGGIGAAVYPAYPSVQNESRLCNMGSGDDATVYAAELRAIEMALEVIQYQFTSNDDWRERLAERGAVIFTDNQAALKAIQTPQNAIRPGIPGRKPPPTGLVLEEQDSG
ncbi:hypothetical protein PDIDSM_4260 [Penicillium digitatum]|nr:hypothetical protein PDIDSM_4260 [Penicillium digitatum]